MKLSFHHLQRRRFLVWSLSLLLIVSCGLAIGGIFWSVRMKTSYRVELAPGGEGIFRASVSRLPLQVFRPGETAALKLGDGEEHSGTLRAFSPRPNRVGLELEFPGLASSPAQGEITIRSQRLLAAFLSPVSPRLGN